MEVSLGCPQVARGSCRSLSVSRYISIIADIILFTKVTVTSSLFVLYKLDRLVYNRAYKNGMKKGE
ncbi:hypothetical protein C6352_20325 [Bacillus thuringiensis]|nr:hypothetical protein C6352_20325 [Bacillus thuringiensis]